jgi:CRP-like cAMP-binding protein
MRRWEAPQGALVCAQGNSGGSCFVVVSGIVEVTTVLGGHPQRLASLGPGSIFGQVSLIDGQPRSATCSMRQAGVLLEMEQEPCARLFDGRSAAALKFLSAINQGLIAALRGADRRLMRAQPEAAPLVDRDLASLPEPIPL